MVKIHFISVAEAKLFVSVPAPVFRKLRFWPSTARNFDKKFLRTNLLHFVKFIPLVMDILFM
jgi:hypothetical protein